MTCTAIKPDYYKAKWYREDHSKMCTSKGKKNTNDNFEGVEEQSLYHGLMKVQSFLVQLVVSDLCYSLSLKEYLLLIPSKHVIRYSIHGHEILPPYSVEGTEFTQLIWASSLNCFLGWSLKSHNIYVAQEDFIILLKASHPSPIVKIMYDDSSRHVIVADSNVVTRYYYLSAARILEKKDETHIVMKEPTPWSLQLCTLAKKDTGCQRVFASHANIIYVFYLDTECYIDNRRHVHTCDITAMLFYPALHWLVIGDTSGTVKCWNKDWDIMLTAAGHAGEIKHIIPHPTIDGFVSVGADNVMQLWNCTLRNKTSKVQLESKVKFVKLNEPEKCVTTLTTNLTRWEMNSLYTFLSALSAPADLIFTTFNPYYPCRTVVCSQDSSVRIICPSTGCQLTTQILSPSLKINCVAYSGFIDVLYSLMANDRGDVVLSYTNQNPARYGKVWFRDRECPSFTVLRVYEHVSRSSIGEDKTNEKTTLLFGGREDGTIVLLHPQKGTVEFITQAHSASVSLLIANPQKDQLVSCGRDSAVKVWKVLPFDTRGLLLLRLTLCYTRHMTHIAIIWDILCLAMCDHTIVMYNLHDKVRYNHLPSRDHLDDIMDMASCESLGICATASKDETIRIWSETNQLLKVLHLNAVPHSLTFCSLRGDIAVCIGKHLYKIYYKKYLSRKYRNKIEICNLPESEEETPYPFIKESLGVVPCFSQIMVLDNKPSIPTLSPDFPDDSLDQSQKRQMCRYQSRDDDIVGIIRGRYTSHRNVPQRELLGSKAWKATLDKLLSAPKEFQGELKPLDIQRLREVNKSRVFDLVQEYKTLFGGSLLEVKEQMRDMLFDFHSQPHVTLGFIPNSVLLKLLGLLRSSTWKQCPSSVQIQPTKELYEQSADSESDNDEHRSKRTLIIGSSVTDILLESVVTSQVDGEVNEDSRKMSHLIKPKKKQSEVTQPEEMSACDSSVDDYSRIKCNMESSPKSLNTVNNEGPISSKTSTLFSEDLTIQKSNGSKTTKSEIAESGLLHPSSLHHKKYEPLDTKPRKKSSLKRSITLKKPNKLEKKLPKETNINIKNIPLYTELVDAKLEKEYEKTKITTTIHGHSSSRHNLSLHNEARITTNHASPEEKLSNLYIQGDVLPAIQKVSELGEDFETLITKALGDIKFYNDIKILFEKASSEKRRKVKDVLIDLLQPLNKSTLLFERLLGILRILNIEGKELVVAVLTSYLVSGKQVRRMIMRSLESQGLSDPSNVLLKYLEDWKTQFGPDEGLIDYNMIKGCVMKWLDHWIDTLKYHVEQVVEQLEQGQVTTVADMFLIQELDHSVVERHQSKMTRVVSGLTMETSELSKQSVENMQSSCEQEKSGAAVPIDIVLVNKLDHVEETSHSTDEIKQIQPDQSRQSEKMQSVNEHSIKDLHTEYLKLTNKFSTGKQSRPAATKYSTTIPFTQFIESDKTLSQTKSGYQNIFLNVVTTAETLQHNVADMFLTKKVACDDVDYHKQSSLATRMLSTANRNIKQKTLDINLEDDTVKMTVILQANTPPGETVQPIEALNYFCELQARRKIKRGPHKQELYGEEVRIIPEHRASLSIRAHPPWDKYIYLPLPRAHIGTGTMVQEGVTYPGPVLLTLKTSQKYFCPKHSYP